MYKHFVSFLLLYPICLVSMSISAQGQGTPGPANPATAQVAPASAPQAADQSPLAKAEQLYRTGKLAEAAQEYNALLQAEPKSVMAYVGLVQDRKSTRLNSSHLGISYAVFCLKKKK